MTAPAPGMPEPDVTDDDQATHELVILRQMRDAIIDMRKLMQELVDGLLPKT